MNTLVTGSRSRHNDPPDNQQSEQQHSSRRASRVGIIDRLALHLGVALVTWSRRPRRSNNVDRVRNQVNRQLAIERLEKVRARDESTYPWFIIR
nr:hypothetical protein [Salinibacterium sp. PAMC 21357]